LRERERGRAPIPPKGVVGLYRRGKFLLVPPSRGRGALHQKGRREEKWRANVIHGKAREDDENLSRNPPSKKKKRGLLLFRQRRGRDTLLARKKRETGPRPAQEPKTPQIVKKKTWKRNRLGPGGGRKKFDPQPSRRGATEIISV